MQHILFETVTFFKPDFSHALVKGTVLTIVLVNNHELTICYKTPEDAKEGLEKLTAIINGKSEKTEKGAPNAFDILKNFDSKAIVSVLEDVQSKIGHVLDDTQAKVQSKVFEQVMKHSVDLGAAEAKVQDMVNNLTSVLETFFQEERKDEMPEQHEKKPARFSRDNDALFTTPAKAVDEFNEAQYHDVLIGDMTATELRKAISAWVDDAIKHERAESMFADIRKNFGDDKANAAIESMKTVIYNLALNEVDLTIEQLVQKYFM